MEFNYKAIDNSGDIENIEKSVTININPINDLPATFVLLKPTDNFSLIISKSNLLDNYVFSWSPSEDQEGEPILYNFIGNGPLEFLSTQGLAVPKIEFDYSYICDNIDRKSVVMGSWTVEATDEICWEEYY